MKSYITVEVSIPIEHDAGVDQAALEQEGFRVVGQVLNAVGARVVESGLVSPDFPGAVDIAELRAVLSRALLGG